MPSDFEDLAVERRLLQEFCESHVESVVAFRSDPSFRLHLDEEPEPALRHLTSTSTCIESLLDCPPRLRPTYTSKLAQDFAKNAIRREEWKSEESAGIYCRCRALPLVVRYLSDEDVIDYAPLLKEHVETILKQLKEPDRFAIGEADPEVKQANWYPPNAYHTFWFLSLLEALAARFGSISIELKEVLCGRRATEMQLWARSMAGRQISLHSANSQTLDSDQLAWSLAILIRFGPKFQSSLADQDFLREGFKALFSKQTKAGTWLHGQRLFHYQYSGNAYCYIYETFAALLRAVLDRTDEGEFLRSAIRPYVRNLTKLWNNARETEIPLPVENRETVIERPIGWSSGHRIEDRRAESWATASVFSYSQGLRRLLGVWTREEALKGLKQVRTFPTAQAAIAEIAKRGDTWSSPSSAPRVSEQLMTLFVNPMSKVANQESLEPDHEAIREQQARSAIMFGPPGTSKTSLARAVAGAIGWRYVELHASHFVAEGLPAVQRTANDLFQKLMELDHVVVLFDEIDELVRERDMEPDAFGRFLTTSMLPKLAELWEQRKVIYFIATNHIEYFDRAVTRARRFDALIFVTPPSFDNKIDRIKKIFSEQLPRVTLEIEFTEEQVNDVLAELESTRPRTDEDLIPDTQVLAKFVLLRWDQLEELVLRIIEVIGNPTTTLSISRDTLALALQAIADPSLQIRKTYLDYKNARRYSMRDYGKDTVWAVSNLSADVSYASPLSVSNNRVWLTCVERPEKLTGQFQFKVEKDGRVSATPLPQPH